MSESSNALISIKEVTQTPWIIDDNGVLKSETILTIVNNGYSFNGWVKIDIEGKPSIVEPAGEIKEGENRITIYMPELDRDNSEVTLQISDKEEQGNVLAAITTQMKKVRHWKIYSAQDMHLDIGFTDHPERLKNEIFPAIIDTAVKHIKETDSWNDDDKFRYPMEESFLLYDVVWSRKNADQIEEIKGFLKDGRMSYSAGYASIAYEAMGTEEIVRTNYFSERYLKDKMGVSSNKLVVKTDDPGISWANVDAMVESGIKYYILRPNTDTNNWKPNVYPKLFYIKGRVPGNRLLFYNSIVYAIDELSFRKGAEHVFEDQEKNIFKQDFIDNITKNLNNNANGRYPCDALLFDYTEGGDNGGINTNVMKNIKALNDRRDAKGRKYVYPKFIHSTANQYFEYVEDNFSQQIPEYKGSIENYWNFGAGSTSYETGINKVNHDKLPAAETFATIANATVSDTRYPYEDILTAYNNMVLYDEHTWGAGPEGCELNDLWRWKRNLAITSNEISDKVMTDSLSALNNLISSEGRTIVIYNNLSWNRTDIVNVNLKDKVPDSFEGFDILDKETGIAVKYQKLEDGSIIFVAENVPGLGYKCFDIVEAPAKTQDISSIKVTGNTIENRFFKVTLDKTGAIESIIDKQNGNKEMIDKSAPHAANQFVYYNSVKQKNDIINSYSIQEAEIFGYTGEVMGALVSVGCTGVEKGVDAMKRSVILYDALPKIDIVNEVVKAQAPEHKDQDEEGFFTFPFKADNFIIRHEMPTGDIRPYVDPNIENPDNEVLYTSCTDHYTVNRWIDISDNNNYGITFAPVNAPIVQYGERRSYKFDLNYNPEKPYIYSYVFNNKWWTNFQKTQPGPITFRYSISSRTGSEWKQGRTDKFGMEASNGFKTSYINYAQTGLFSGIKGQFIKIDKDNVVLSTAKIAEANGEGVILRFNETLGLDTNVTVDVSIFNASAAIETDLVENDRQPVSIDNGMLQFAIAGHGWKTFRLTGLVGDVSKVTGVKAVADSKGTHVSWNMIEDKNLSCYEVFRGQDSNFEPGPGNYIATVSKEHYFDNQVTGDICEKYFYKIRGVVRGMRGPASDGANAVSGVIEDTVAPSAPKNLKFNYIYKTRVSMSWLPSSDNVAVEGYRIYRNGEVYKDVPAIINSDLDTDFVPSCTYEYYVRAYDKAGNLSEPSNIITFTSEYMPKYKDLAREAKVSVSSYLDQHTTSLRFSPINIISDAFGFNNKGEWVSSEKNPWILFEWDEPNQISRINLHDRINGMENIDKAVISFSDGSSLEVTEIPHNGSLKAISFPAKTVSWMKINIYGTEGTTLAGLSEIQIFE